VTATCADRLRKADEALQIKSDFDRQSRLGDLLEWATNDRRHGDDPRGDYAQVIAMLRARVGRAIEELRAVVHGPDDPARPRLDLERLLWRLEAIRLARTDPDA
jgi:hypothetical protein